MFTGKKNICFFNVDLKPISIYTLCSQEKSYVFLMWDLKPISIYNLYSKKKVMFFQCGINFFFKYSFKLYYLKYV